MSIISRLKALFKGRPAPATPDAIPVGKERIHFLAGDFRDESSARSYCYDATLNRPEKLTRDQPGAFIDTTHVEVDFGTHKDRLTEIFDPEDVRNLMNDIDGQNTLIIIAEPAFGGLPYRLGDTDILSYLGSKMVDV